MDLAARLAEQEALGLTRRQRIVDGPQQVDLRVDGRDLVSFCSNDYLGLANHPEVKQAFKQGVDQYGAGSGAAHLITGHTRAHQRLEEELAAFTGYGSVLLFSTGYMANLAILSTLADRHDVIYEDRLNHASLIDGGQISRARVRRYRHGDAEDLARLIEQDSPQGGMVATDGVFSMEGSIAPLQSLAEISASNNLLLAVDDAHGFGILGDGKGTVADAGLNQSQVPVLMATFGKALGTFGAFVAGADEIIESLIQFARSYIYTTAPPAAIAEATHASLQIVRDDSERRQRLLDHIAYFRNAAGENTLPIAESFTPIQVLVMPGAQEALHAQALLEERGLLVGAIRPPTVPEACLRITLCSEHRREDIDALVDALSAVMGVQRNG